MATKEAKTPTVVKALFDGFYNAQRIRAGMTFRLNCPDDFSGRWMVGVNDDEPITAPEPQPIKRGGRVTFRDLQNTKAPAAEKAPKGSASTGAQDVIGE